MANYVENVLKPLDDVKSKAAPGKLLETIRENDSVKDAHKAFLQSLKSNWIQQASHGHAVQLLNCISAAYCESVLPEGDAVIFTRHSKAPTGNYLALDIKPDICGFLGPLATLLLARQHQNYKSYQAWSTLVEVADLERHGDQEILGRLASYLVGLKRYRPDMTTVHGICLAEGLVHLATLTTTGGFSSDPVSWSDLSPWIAHVVEIYNSLAGRDLDMEYCAAQEGFPRWDIHKAGVGLAVTPFHVGPAPGRTTFACFEVGRLPVDRRGTDPQVLADLNQRSDSGIVEGFWKLSWQRTDAKPTEPELLTYLHRNGWVPGLVRHYPETTLRGEDASAIRHPPVEGNVGYVRDILHLGSIGQPLSQCETAGDLLDVMYDLIETHAHLCELGVIHRDVSYYNVLCKPQHYITTHPVLKNNCLLERPCIKKIFGDESGQSSVLLTDLDHATKFAELEKEPVDASKFVGTRPFMSVYLSNPKIEREYEEFKKLNRLLLSLEAVTEEPDLFQRAFPKGDNDFIAKFKLVLEAERLRHKKNYELPYDAQTDYMVAPLTHHDWRHDAESIYWVFLYAFSRARPLGPPEPEDDVYDIFCRAMLTSSTSEFLRERWLSPFWHRGLFPKPLARLGDLFYNMAIYLTIPWHLYCGEGGIMAGNRDHVHVAFRRLILSFKRAPESAAALCVCFDTAAPRVTTAFEPLHGHYYDDDADTDPDVLPITVLPAPLTEDTRFSTAQKRLAEEQGAAILRGSLDVPPDSEGASTAVNDDAQQSAVPADSCADTGASTVVTPAQVSVARKRKAASSSEEATTVDGGSASDIRYLKRSKTSHAEPLARGEDASDTRNTTDIAQPQAGLDASQKCTTTGAGGSELCSSKPEADALDGNADDSEKPQDKFKVEDKYDASLHLHSRSAKALCLMVLKDRDLWFGSGKGK